MFDDDLDYLRTTPRLHDLLAGYARAAVPDREAWQDRIMSLDGVAPAELVRLHGLLLAMAWIDQNTGNTPRSRPGVAAGCYRITLAGLRALRLASPQRQAEVPSLAEAA